jgi:hypothetical protein
MWTKKRQFALPPLRYTAFSETNQMYSYDAITDPLWNEIRMHGCFPDGAAPSIIYLDLGSARLGHFPTELLVYIGQYS